MEKLPAIQHIYKQTASGPVFYAWFACMHTRADIVLRREEAQGVQLTEAVRNKLRALEAAGNFYHPASELSVVNNARCGAPTVIGADLFRMLEMCIVYNRVTAGYFDISVGSGNYAPGTLACVRLQKENSSVTLGRAGVRLDLSGFIKGYALDEIRNILEAGGVTDALVNLGNSSVLALGDHPSGNGWKIGIAFPSAAGGKKEVVLKNECLTTSGNHTAGRRHIRSPYTGRYITGVRGVSVVTAGGAEGEALSTALFAAPPHERSGIVRHFEATVYELNGI
ncbi:MAG: FAD:protein FMN transferase [Parabacteroides sp.]|nr:FAD:protein FMN transferase [Parabacteroides sp.]